MAAKKKARKAASKVKSKAKAKAKAVKSRVKAKAKSTKKKAKKAAKTTKSAVVRFTESALVKKTGKTLTQWFTLLDEAGGRAMQNADITSLLKARHQVADWASKGVAQAYAQARGLKKLQKTAQKAATKAVASASRTLFDALDKVEGMVTQKK